MKTQPLILASGSPRRRAFLAELGVDFRIQSADIDETPLPNELPTPLAVRLAESKARAVADRLRDAGESGVVLAADTVVALDDHLLSKPVDAAEARHMLATLRGRVHQVVTAVSALDIASGKQTTRASQADVTMRLYSNEEMDAYIATCDPFDKAGGYAIQNTLFAPVASWQGSYTTIMGLPLEELPALLGEFGQAIDPALLALALRNAETQGGR